MLHKFAKRLQRHARIRSKVSGTATRPRLAVYRSNGYIHAQLIDDDAGKTIAAVSDLKMKKSGTKTEMAIKVGEEMWKKITELKITEIVFDRGGFAYHGRVKALAEAVRSASITF